MDKVKITFSTPDGTWRIEDPSHFYDLVPEYLEDLTRRGVSATLEAAFGLYRSAYPDRVTQA